VCDLIVTAVAWRARMAFEIHTLSRRLTFQRNIIAKMVLGL